MCRMGAVPSGSGEGGPFASQLPEPRPQSQTGPPPFLPLCGPHKAWDTRWARLGPLRVSEENLSPCLQTGQGSKVGRKGVFCHWGKDSSTHPNTPFSVKGERVRHGRLFFNLCVKELGLTEVPFLGSLWPFFLHLPPDSLFFFLSKYQPLTLAS